ncbi:hypothetical protein BC940DRAFT_290208 [Gongronella butleri]|nr:hypothetical protein BC940DRAFT_290208 [Gongronella butleri]
MQKWQLCIGQRFPPAPTVFVDRASWTIFADRHVRRMTLYNYCRIIVAGSLETAPKTEDWLFLGHWRDR